MEEGFFRAENTGEGSIMVAQADFLAGGYFSIADGALERPVSLVGREAHRGYECVVRKVGCKMRVLVGRKKSVKVKV